VLRAMCLDSVYAYFNKIEARNSHHAPRLIGCRPRDGNINGG
jgi:hypothetical protein